MKSTVSFDVRVAKYIKRRLDGYLLRREKKEKEAAKIRWQQKFNGTDSFVHTLEDGLKIKLYNDSVLSKLIFDGFEQGEIAFVSAFLSKGDWFVDIGANVGLFSLFASKRVGPEGMVISFEPSGVTYARLMENIGLNGLGNVKAFQMGLSDKPGVLELNISENGYEAWNTFVQSADNKFSRKEQVPVRAFDGLFEEQSLDTDKIALIKLDVEGFEMNVLKGATRLLSKANAPVFVVEFTNDNALTAGHCCHEIYRLLAEFGYRWYVYDEEHNTLRHDPIKASYPYENLIAIKNLDRVRNLGRFSIEDK